AARSAGCQAWTGTQPANPGSDSEPNGVAVLSPCDAWAVGQVTNATGHGQTLIPEPTGSTLSVCYRWPPSPAVMPGQSAASAGTPTGPSSCTGTTISGPKYTVPVPATALTISCSPWPPRPL